MGQWRKTSGLHGKRIHPRRAAVPRCRDGDPLPADGLPAARDRAGALALL